jgi:uncharacterized membrane protein
MISKSEIIENLERNLFELDARFEKALVDLNKANAEISLRGREVERQAAEILELQTRNGMQAETISRYRDELSELSHGYRS